MAAKGATVRAANVVVSLAAETTVLSGIPAAMGNASSHLDQTIQGSINITAGTGTTAVVLKCKNASAVQVGTSQTNTLAAGNSDVIPFCFVDNSGAASASYQITLTQTGGTANGTVGEIVGYCIGEG